MCVTSMIGEHYTDKWAHLYPQFQQWEVLHPPPISREEFDALRRDVLEMKKLLERAAEYDRRNNEPECEVEDKVALLRKVAEMVGIPDAVAPITRPAE